MNTHGARMRSGEETWSGRRWVRVAAALAAAALAWVVGGTRAVAEEKVAAPVPGFFAGEVLAADDFSAGTGQWRAELEKGGSVTARDGVLDIDVPGGCTLWLARELSGPLLIEYEAAAVSAGGPNDRVSDLNCFWMAQDARSPGDLFATPRGGKFAEYDRLRCYYVGLGGNGNTTTRFRRYLGESGNRPLRPEDDRAAAEFLLVANAWQKLQLVAAGSRVECWRDGRRIFSLVDEAPYRRGWFALRTVASHLRVRNFRVVRLVAE